MPEYTVRFTSTVSTVVKVEATTPKDAVELAYDSPQMPGAVVYGATPASIDESGEWEPTVVTDGDGVEMSGWGTE